MIPFGKIFFDTAPFIYLLENHPKYGQIVDDFIVEATSNNVTLVTSILSLAEFGVVPERNKRQDLIDDFEDLLRNAAFEIPSIEKQTAINSYQLRAKYQSLKALDSLQLAVAINSGCDHFFTNDFKLKSISEINILIVDSV